MAFSVRDLAFLTIVSLAAPAVATSSELLHERVDACVEAKAAGLRPGPTADDAEFLRRIYLDLAGRTPSAREARDFLADHSPAKREALIDRLLAGADYPRRMADLFDGVLMERLGDHPAWTQYLQDAFAVNKPWDRIAREILRADPVDKANRGASFFMAKRLEHYGENPVDYNGLAADVGRLFLGNDLRCAQCHDHIFITDYKQRDFQGLLAFVRNAYVHDPKGPVVGEKPTTDKLAFASVFEKLKAETGPRVPGRDEVAVPSFKKGDEFRKPADPKAGLPALPRFSPLSELSAQLPSPENRAFARNTVNRLWLAMMGRGLVHPPDQHHSDNLPSNPELLDLLADEFVAHRFDVRWLLRELALSKTYQRSGVMPEGVEPPAPESFLIALEKRLSAEQLLRSMLQATGDRDSTSGKAEERTDFTELRARFLKAFANPPREPEEEFSPTLRSALFVLNDGTVVGWLEPRPGNLVDRLAGLSGADAVAEELYMSVLSRPPTAEEREEVAASLDESPDKRPTTLRDLVWSLLASTEFFTNH